MLFDLTAVSSKRVSQVDEMHVGGSHWIRLSTFGWAMGGLFAGAGLSMLLRATVAPGQLWPWLAAPAVALAAVVLFDPARSMEGENTRRRIDAITARLKRPDGVFFTPGTLDVYEPNSLTVFDMHDHPID